ncbi:pentapeptide repeat-containing protein [Oceaniglobus trochenteri]|uniref:pentapeptide repeat-containing protein n=1 Tax=Oceaniglobus trochenteri TaxID=2763260 RepID=UPI00247A5638|nr:pentapeptide repeat-containing protein [Oceaniglobus trochenteri]
MQYEIRNRWTGAVQFAAVIDCAPSAPDSVKRGLAVKWALRNDADLCDANLRGANLRGADLCDANLRGANLRGADLCDADLLCMGNMREVRTMQIDKWPIGYTASDLQIGCQRHAIDKWRKWNSEAGLKWVAQMDSDALSWADRNLALVLQIIDANPATTT